MITRRYLIPISTSKARILLMAIDALQNGEQGKYMRMMMMMWTMLHPAFVSRQIIVQHSAVNQTPAEKQDSHCLRPSRACWSVQSMCKIHSQTICMSVKQNLVMGLALSNSCCGCIKQAGYSMNLGHACSWELYEGPCHDTLLPVAWSTASCRCRLRNISFLNDPSQLWRLCTYRCNHCCRREWDPRPLGHVAYA